SVARATGGLYDTVRPLDVDASSGNGFTFWDYDPGGLRWAIDRAMDFLVLPAEVRWREIRRVMNESRREFSYDRVARQYMDRYEAMLARPLVNRKASVACAV